MKESNKKNNTIDLQKIASEKSFAVADSSGKYTYLVGKGVSKIEIARKIELDYKVKVDKVNIVSLPGKRKRDWKTGRSFRLNDKRKAVVTLAEGRIKDFTKI